MIEILKNRVFINGIECNNPIEIGYAMLEAAQNDTICIVENKLSLSIDKEKVLKKFSEYLKNNAFRVTWERNTLIELLTSMNNFTSSDFVKQGMALNVSYPTCYNFLQSCVEAEIICLTPKTYTFNENFNI